MFFLLLNLTITRIEIILKKNHVHLLFSLLKEVQTSEIHIHLLHNFSNNKK